MIINEAKTNSFESDNPAPINLSNSQISGATNIIILILNNKSKVSIFTFYKRLIKFSFPNMDLLVTFFIKIIMDRPSEPWPPRRRPKTAKGNSVTLLGVGFHHHLIIIIFSLIDPQLDWIGFGIVCIHSRYGAKCGSSLGSRRKRPDEPRY